MCMPAAQHGCELTCFPLCTDHSYSPPLPLTSLCALFHSDEGQLQYSLRRWMASIRSKPCTFPPLVPARSYDTGTAPCKCMPGWIVQTLAFTCTHKRDAAAFHGSIIPIGRMSCQVKPLRDYPLQFRRSPYLPPSVTDQYRCPDPACVAYKSLSSGLPC
jgi:hypothetical protein